MATEGSAFGPYELERRLGAGGMAETFVAVRRGPGGFEQRVCLKRILPAFEADEDFVAQFLHEARLSAKLRHTNIAQVIDFGVHDGSHYLALELVEGADLRGLLKALRKDGDPRLPHSLVGLLAVELAAALDHAGDHDVVHRDLSPANVLLSTAGEVKLTDFGIARAIDQPGLTRSGVVKGKVPYMAPEYANSGQCDARSDLFALGVVLFECLAGERPYQGSTDLETVARATNGAHRPLAELVPEAPPALVVAIERLIRPDPAVRFSDGGALLDALTEAPPPPNARRELGTLVRAHRKPPAAASRVVRPPPTSGADEAGTVVDGARAGPRPAAPAEDPGSRPPPETEGSDLAHRATELARHPPGATATQALPEADEPPPAAAPPGDLRIAGPHEPTRTRPRAGAPAPPAPADATEIGPPASETDSEGAETPLVPADTAPPLRKRRRWILGVAAGLVVAAGLAAMGGGRLSTGSGTEPPEPTGASDEPTGAGGDPEPAGATPDFAAPPAETAAPSAVSGSDDRPSAEPAGESADATEPAAPEEPDADEEAPPSEASSDDAPPDAPRARTDRKRASHAVLRIVVIPYGEVWIDGRHVGPSPARVRVRPGSHTVATGEGAPERSTTVRVSAGQHRRVTLR